MSGVAVKAGQTDSMRRFSAVALAAGVIGLASVTLLVVMVALDVSPFRHWAALDAYASRLEAAIGLVALVLPALALAGGGLLVLAGERRRAEVGAARIAFWTGVAGLSGLAVSFFVAVLWFSSGWTGP